MRLKDADLAQKFKEAVEAAQLYNKLVGEGKSGDELVEAPVVEDIDEVEPDSIENVNAGEAGDDDKAE